MLPLSYLYPTLSTQSLSLRVSLFLPLSLILSYFILFYLFWQADEAKAQFAHVDGDHLSLLNVYHAYKQVLLLLFTYDTCFILMSSHCHAYALITSSTLFMSNIICSISYIIHLLCCVVLFCFIAVDDSRYRNCSILHCRTILLQLIHMRLQPISIQQRITIEQIGLDIAALHCSRHCSRHCLTFYYTTLYCTTLPCTLLHHPALYYSTLLYSRLKYLPQSLIIRMNWIDFS